MCLQMRMKQIWVRMCLLDLLCSQVRVIAYTNPYSTHTYIYIYSRTPTATYTTHTHCTASVINAHSTVHHTDAVHTQFTQHAQFTRTHIQMFTRTRARTTHWSHTTTHCSHTHTWQRLRRDKLIHSQVYYGVQKTIKQDNTFSRLNNGLYSHNNTYIHTHKTQKHSITGDP